MLVVETLSKFNGKDLNPFMTPYQDLNIDFNNNKTQYYLDCKKGNIIIISTLFQELFYLGRGPTPDPISGPGFQNSFKRYSYNTISLL
jgi:hypothetical protein